jgi:hypothetical protein
MLPNASEPQTQKQHILDRCRGLLETKHGRIYFSHRAIPESLQNYFDNAKLTFGLSDIRIAELLAWLVLADSRQGRQSMTIPFLLRRVSECDLRGCEDILHLLSAVDLAQKKGPHIDDDWLPEVSGRWTGAPQVANMPGDFIHECQILRIYEYVGWSLNTRLE